MRLNALLLASAALAYSTVPTAMPFIPESFEFKIEPGSTDFYEDRRI